jgi:hypothetical protein
VGESKPKFKVGELLFVVAFHHVSNWKGRVFRPVQVVFEDGHPGYVVDKYRMLFWEDEVIRYSELSNIEKIVWGKYDK